MVIFNFPSSNSEDGMCFTRGGLFSLILTHRTNYPFPEMAEIFSVVEMVLMFGHEIYFS